MKPSKRRKRLAKYKAEKGPEGRRDGLIRFIKAKDTKVRKPDETDNPLR